MNLFVLGRMFPRNRNERGRFLPRKNAQSSPNNNTKKNSPSPLLDIRTEEQIPELRQLILNGPTIYVLIHADWCGPCQRYKPEFKEIAKTPGRTANVAMVHHDIMEKVPELKNAKITGYPSVVKVNPTGTVEEYKVPGSPETTNVVPQMNDPKVMKELVKAVQTSQPNAKIPGPQGVLLSNTNFVKKNAQITTNAPQAGGALNSVLGAFMGALNKAGPAALLLLGNSLLTKRSKTYKSPKRHSRRASTRRNRRNR